MQALGGKTTLLEVEAIQQPQHQQPVQSRALPGGEQLNREWGETQLARRTAMELGAGFWQGRAQAARIEIEVPLDQRQHRAQVGGLGQAVTPAPFKRLEHRRADPGLKRQLAQAEVARLPGLA